MLDHHAEEYADDAPVWKREVGVDISEHLVGGQSAGLQDLILDCKAYRLARVIVDNALAANAVGA